MHPRCFARTLVRAPGSLWRVFVPKNNKAREQGTATAGSPQVLRAGTRGLQKPGVAFRHAALARAALCFAAAAGCATSSLRSAVTLEVDHAKATPRDASVYIDEQYIGPLYYVSAYGVRLPVGEHRITVTREGYFPWDRLVQADRRPLSLTVKLVQVPD